MAGTLLKLIAGALAGPAIVQAITNTYPPYQALVARKAYAQHPDLIPTTEQLVTLRRRGEIDSAKYQSLMAMGGISNELSEQLYIAAQNYLTAFDYITDWRRGNITEEQLDIQLEKIGFEAEQRASAKRVTLYYPNPDDIVRFAVREVYTPEVVEKYGLMEDMPANYIPAALKGSLSKEFAEQYWASHWELPSPNQIYEMRHRRIIADDDVELYLKTADYMPYWRDKLLKLSFRPYTRVDVRRMHKMGILSRQQVFEAYQDIGFDDEKAENMTRFTEAYNKGTEGEAPEQPILQQYYKGTIDRAEATNLLTNEEFSPEEITNLLDMVDDEIKWETIDLKADAIIEDYRSGVIDNDELKVKLTAIGVPNKQLEQTIARELIQAKKRSRIPSVTDAKDWFVLGIIDEDGYRKIMGLHGYNTVYIDNYIEEIFINLVQDSDKLLSVATYRRWFVEGRMTVDEYIDKLKRHQYNDNDIEDEVNSSMDKMKK